MNIIGTKTDNSFTYKAGFMGRTVGIHAASLLEARKQAEVYFKPTRKNVGYLWVEKATEDETD